ncbi:uncharacterized protein RCO7_07445 [Rhynchosporium graminicola]|uniref:RNase H type-1 domain-containing protein n=1 Tax=Rhynchosporium graminicola TaxID=2792576 RepID=A0A1E1LN35_9HELO|nr:uncharacterized protein RCO7_07445 [Rhynchosporium commune]
MIKLDGLNERIFHPERYFIGPGRIEALEQPSDIIHHILHRDRATGLSRLVINNLKVKRKIDRTLTIDTETIVVAIDGAVHTRPDRPSPPFRDGNDEVKTPISGVIEILPKVDAEGRIFNTSTRAGYKIFFGPKSLHNQSGLVQHEGEGIVSKMVPTRETAVLVGCTVLQHYVLTTLAPSSHGLQPPTFPLQTTAGIHPLQQVVILTSSPYVIKCMTSYVQVWEENGYVDSRGMFVENARELRDLEYVVGRCERRGVRVRFWCVKGGEKGIGDLEDLGEARGMAEQVWEDGETREGNGEKVIERQGGGDMGVEGKREDRDEEDRQGNRGSEMEVSLENWDSSGIAIRILPTGNIDEREEPGDERGVLARTEDMDDMEALELELEKGFVSF